MKLLKQAFAVFGVVTMFAILAAVIAPKSAHALVAALVQIVPGTTTHVGQNESQLVSLTCSADTGRSCVILVPSTMPSTTPYVVPTGYTLIVTDWQWSDFPEGSAGVLVSDLLFSVAAGTTQTGGLALTVSSAITDQHGNSYTHEHYATGLRVASGQSLIDYVVSAGLGSADVQGYLVPND
jgi:hypothetical protein